jgi:hypothetical protein
MLSNFGVENNKKNENNDYNKYKVERNKIST